MPDLDMTPYGPFVWGAFGASVLALGALAAAVWRRARRAARRLSELEPSK